MIVQVCKARSDAYYEVPEEELRRIYGLPGPERAESFYDSAEEASVHSSEQADAVLVLDGENDGESWEELAEEMGWKDA